MIRIFRSHQNQGGHGVVPESQVHEGNKARSLAHKTRLAHLETLASCLADVFDGLESERIPKSHVADLVVESDKPPADKEGEEHHYRSPVDETEVKDGVRIERVLEEFVEEPKARMNRDPNRATCPDCVNQSHGNLLLGSEADNPRPLFIL